MQQIAALAAHRQRSRERNDLLRFTPSVSVLLSGIARRSARVFEAVELGHTVSKEAFKARVPQPRCWRVLSPRAHLRVAGNDKRRARIQMLRTMATALTEAVGPPEK